MIADPKTAARLLSGEIARAPAPEAGLNLFHLMPWNNMQLERLGDGLEPDLALDGARAASDFFAIEARNTAALLAFRRSAQSRTLDGPKHSISAKA